MQEMRKSLAKSQEMKRQEEIGTRQKEFRDFNLKEVRKFQKKYRRLEKKQRVLSASMSRASNYKIIHDELEPSKTRHIQRFTELKKRLEEKRIQRDKIIDDILNDPLHKDFTARHQKQLTQIYNFYLRQQNFELRDEEDPDLLPHAGMRALFHDFQIVPFIMSPSEETKIFNRFSTERKLDTEGGEPGLNYVQFTRLLCAICTRKTQLFNKIFENRVHNLQDFEYREKTKEDHSEKIHRIKEKELEKKQRLNKSTKNLQVVDKETAEALEARKAKEEADKKKEIENKKKRRLDEEEYVRKLERSPVRFLEGFMAYLHVPDVKSGINETIQKLQAAKSQPTREILKSTLSI